MPESISNPEALRQLYDNHYEGLFFDGRTSKAHPAWVWLQEDGLRICFQRGEGLVEETFWPIANILKDDFSTEGSVLLRFDSKPVEKLEVNEPGFLQDLQISYKGKPFLRSPYQLLRVGTTSRNTAIAVTLLVLLWLLWAMIGL